MALYRNAYRKELETENEDDELELGGTEEETVVSESNDPFSKRYADLRRGSQKALNERDNEIKTLKEQLAEAAKANVKYPKSEDEVKAWMDRYPDVGGIVKTIVLKELADYDTGKAPEFNRVKELEEQIARTNVERQKEIAIKEIEKVHSDFFSLVDDTTEKGKKFHAWVAEQDDWVKYALYENETKSKPAIDAITLYKTEHKGYDKEDRKKAAGAVGRSSSTPKEGSNARFSESMVEKMNPVEYARLEPQIMAAIEAGEFNYDLQ